MSKKAQYFNFPIWLLSGFMENKHEILNNILYYGIFYYMLNTSEYVDEEIHEVCYFEEAANKLNVKLRNTEKAYKQAEALHANTPAGVPFSSISTHVFWQYYNEEKTEFEYTCFLAYIAFKSMIGSKAYMKATNAFMLARMDGKTKQCDYSELSPSIAQYAHEYQTKKIRGALENWGLVFYARYTRGFYFSHKLRREQLIFEAEKKRKSYIEKQRKKETEAIRKRVIEMLKSGAK